MATSKPCVYVIELESGVLKNKKFLEKNPDMKKGKLCVYVGSTGIDPEERFEFGKLYYAWTLKAGKNLGTITGNAIKLDWTPETTIPEKNTTNKSK